MAFKAEVIKHKERLNEEKIKLISFISFLLGFSQAVLIYVMSYYFKSAWGTENVGLFYTISYGFILLILLNFHKVVQKVGKSAVLYFSTVAKIVSLVFLVFLKPSMWSVAFLMLYMIGNAMEWLSLDIILESFSKDQVSGRIRGVHLAIYNAGFIFGPLISAQILDRYSFSGIFFFVLCFEAFIFVLALIGLNGVNHVSHRKLKVLDVIRKAFKRKNIMRIYYISFVLEFFFSLMVIYAPLYLLDLGFTWDKISIMFTMMLIPFVILPYPAGVLADKKTGEKEMIIFSIIMMAVSTFALFFLHSMSVFVWGVALFATRIGASLIETLRDSYFYKKIDGSEVDMIDFFRTAMPIAYIISTGLSFLMLLFLPLKAAFLFVGIIVLTALYPAFQLIDNASEDERSA
jgi:MFS family permease